MPLSLFGCQGGGELGDAYTFQYALDIDGTKLKTKALYQERLNSTLGDRFHYRVGLDNAARFEYNPTVDGVALTYGEQSEWIDGGSSGFYDTPELRQAIMSKMPTAWAFKSFLPIRHIYLSVFTYNVNTVNTSGATVLDDRLTYWAFRVTGIRKDGTKSNAVCPVMFINGSRVASADAYSGLYLDNGYNRHQSSNFPNTQECSWAFWISLQNHTHCADVIFGDFAYWICQYVNPQILKTSTQSFPSALFYMRRLIVKY